LYILRIRINQVFILGFKSLVGGEIKGLSKLTSDLRDELLWELKEKAVQAGANAIVGLRFDQNIRRRVHCNAQ